MTRSACVTPSRVLLFPPLPEQSNRVVKKYKTQSKHFIRVSFVDDNFGQLDIVAVPFPSLGSCCQTAPWWT
jgi:hypothetical protein